MGWWKSLFTILGRPWQAACLEEGGGDAGCGADAGSVAMRPTCAVKRPGSGAGGTGGHQNHRDAAPSLLLLLLQGPSPPPQSCRAGARNRRQMAAPRATGGAGRRTPLCSLRGNNSADSRTVHRSQATWQGKAVAMQGAAGLEPPSSPHLPPGTARVRAAGAAEADQAARERARAYAFASAGVPGKCRPRDWSRS